MKKATISGFNGYTFFNNKTITDPKGKKVKIGKDGAVVLTATETIDGHVVAGEKYNYNIEELMTALADAWVDVEATTSAPAKDFEFSEPTQAEQHREAVKAAKAELAAASKALLNKVLSGEDVTAESEAVRVAQEKVNSLSTTKPVKEESQELKDAHAALIPLKEAFENAKTALDVARKALATQVEVIKGLGGNVGKRSAGGDHRAKLSYETAQEIRKDYAVGRYGNEGTSSTAVDIAAKYGISVSSLKYIVNYQQHKLHKGDTAYTPLINEYYPALGTKGNVTGTDGAPYVEDGVKEDRKMQYTIAEKRVIPAAEAATA